MRRIIAIAVFLVSTASCVTSYRQALNGEMDIVDQQVPADQQDKPISVQPINNLDTVEAQEEREHAGFDIDEFKDHPQVKKWLDYFTKRRPELFQRYMHRGAKYETMMKSILKKRNIPTFFYYLAMIESGFSTRAKSHMGAYGPWQFMRATGRRYGLRVNDYVDERSDPLRATIAAAEYLNDLNRVFNSWPLAIAAYNAGEFRILNSVMRHGSRDFWELAEANAIPRETRDYFPKFVAATIIGRNPEIYGLQQGVAEDPIPQVTSISFPAPSRLYDIAKAVGISREHLMELNPHLRRGVTPPGNRTYRIWVPEDLSLAAESIAKVQRLKIKPQANPEYNRYRVRRGDNWYEIAKRHGISVRKIKRINGRRSNRIIAGERILVPKGGTFADGGVRKYKVRRGDNLITLAQRFGTSVKEIRRLNRLSRSTIYVGQVLKISAI